MDNQLDYQKLGLKCGIEIHQQLEGKKLFCRCPTTIRKEPPDFVVRRELHAAAGEEGVVDVAALHEQAKGKYFFYQGYHDTTCLVELDEEPPCPINQEALAIAVQAAQLLHCTIVDEIQVMRKTVIDGSNTSGFQRTALVGMDGHVDVNGKRVPIPTVCLEEEACQVMERTPDHDVYNLSRLGIPLVEIATGPDMATPEECREVALHLGMVLRSVPGMKRGIGSIRQDVNLSIRGGARIEIKGFQEVKSIPSVMMYEVERQLGILHKKKTVVAEVRKAEPDGTTSYLRPMPGAARMYPETDVMPVRPGKEDGSHIELLSDKAKQLELLGIGKDLADAAVSAGKSELITSCAAAFKNVKPAFIAETIVSTPKTIRRKDGIEIAPSDEEYRQMFAALDKGSIAKEAVYGLLLQLGKTGKLDISSFTLLSDKEVEEEVKKVIKENTGAPQGKMVGLAMAKLRGKADPKVVMEMVGKLL